MIGKFIVYESLFRDRWVAREVVGETEHFLVVKPVQPMEARETPARKIKKTAIGPMGVFKDSDTAEIKAQGLTLSIANSKRVFEDDKRKFIKHMMGTTNDT